MNTREIIRQARAGTLVVPEEVEEDPWFGVRVGDRVAYSSVRYLPSLPFIQDLPEPAAWLRWLELADTGTIIGLVTDDVASPRQAGILEHAHFWATTAEVIWDNGKHDYIKTGLLYAEDEEHPIAKRNREENERWT